jgi:DnaJ like chaperone protein
MASVWQRLGEIVGSISDRTGVVGSLANAFDPDNWLPGGKDAAFTLALIALSAKMAVSDGVVTASELRAFHRTVEIPAGIEQQVDRVFKLAQQDVAGYQA